ncbi:MAG TPA: hypothetical protein PKI59_03240, partial [Candidatus Cloacimonadota bacterium]|nr:hypothetical protein [Candidatus Cloacimonadota bacterium]
PNWFPDPADNWIWRGNFPLWGDNTATYINHSNLESSSPMKKRYIELRNEAKEEYATSRTFSFAVVLNHIAAGIDAVRLSRDVNREAISDTGLRVNYYTMMREDRLTPMLGLNWSF